MNQTDKISSFLYFGYLPIFNKNSISNILPNIDLTKFSVNSHFKDLPEAQLISEGKKALISAHFNTLEKVNGDIHIIPLSGGLDSRAVLATLLSLGLRKKIYTVTFGIPGAWDYELGIKIAKEFELPHINIDLNKVKVRTYDLQDTATNGCSWTFILDGFYNSLICKEFGKNAVYWSAFLGEDLAGDSFIPGVNSWEKAIKLFSKNKLSKFVNSIDLQHPDYDPYDSLPSTPIMESTIIDFYEQLWFFIRKHNYIIRVLKFDNYNYTMPLCSPEWIQFILTVPQKYRVNKYIYKKILLSAYPELFCLPVTENRGGPLSAGLVEIKIRRALHRIRSNFDHDNPIWDSFRIFRDIKYIDFDEAIRSRQDFRLLVLENLQDLKQRNKVNWLDLDSIWKDHQLKRANHGMALLLLTALEISLKSDEAKIINS